MSEAPPSTQPSSDPSSSGASPSEATSSQVSAREEQHGSNIVRESEVVTPQYRLRCLRMPLAVYREVAAHLRQVEGVDTGLLPQTSREFDYTKSQVGGLWISYQPEAGDISHRQTEEILAYYGDRFGTWEAIYPES